MFCAQVEAWLKAILVPNLVAHRLSIYYQSTAGWSACMCTVEGE